MAISTWKGDLGVGVSRGLPLGTGHGRAAWALSLAVSRAAHDWDLEVSPVVSSVLPERGLSWLGFFSYLSSASEVIPPGLEHIPTSLG